MWKDKTAVSDIGIYSVFEVKGLNQDRLINTLIKNGISLYNIKKFSNKKMRISIRIKDNTNFFAITKKLCYNIKKVHYEGKNYPFYYILKNMGLFIGAVLLIVFSYFANDFIFSVEFTGSGVAYERYVKDYLDEKGIVPFSRFSSIDLNSLSDNILSENENFTFVNSQKKGNRLVIELVLSENEQKYSLGANSKIVSECDGIIENLKVYRGTSVKSIGESVKKGDVIVEGYKNVKDNVVAVNPVAYFTIITNFEKDFESKNDNEENLALIFAENFYYDEDIITKTVNKNFDGEKYVYKVSLSIRKEFYK